MDYTILVNKDNLLDSSYQVTKLVPVGKIFKSDKNTYTDEDILLEEIAAKFLKKMIQDANKIDLSVKVIPDSGYRSISYQQEVMNYYIKKEGLAKAKKRVATPGSSEHHTGLAIDIAIFNNGVYTDDITGKEPTIKFIHNNCYKYGFILRYPKGKEDITGYNYEPWHFRYVGTDLDSKLYNNGDWITMESYFGFTSEYDY